MNQENNYTSGDAYLQDLLELTDTRLRFSQNNIEAQTALEKMEYTIAEKLLHSPQAPLFPFVHIKTKFSLSSFQCHCILCALLFDCDKKEINLLQKKSYTVRQAAESFFPSLSYCRLKEELSHHFCSLFLESTSSVLQPLWEIPLSLASPIRNVLLSSNNPLPLYKKYNLIPTDTPFPKTKQATHISSSFSKMPRGTCYHIYGRKGSGRLFLAKQSESESEAYDFLLLCSLSELFFEKMELWESRLYEILRLSLLHQAVIVLNDLEALPNKDRKIAPFFSMVFLFLQQNCPHFILITEEEQNLTPEIPSEIPVIPIAADNISKEEQEKIWSFFTNEILLSTKERTALIQKYQLNPGEIKSAIKKAKLLLLSQKYTSPSSLLWKEACHTSCGTLPELGAFKVQPKGSWNDLIIAKEQKDLLNHACNYVRLQHIVYEQWDFQSKLPYGRNISLLMEGPPGTGKTMAAQLIAKELELDLFQLDISKTVSKYIGETEKNLNRIFDEAQRSHAILFIDEMDTFFNKRTAIKDSHDKYANMETSFLLQKLENYRGILLLATNYLSNIDEAFIRRIQFIIHFTLPQKEDRKKLWQTMLSAKAPLSEDIDFNFLAENFEVSGGTIKNIIIKGAFLAAAHQGIICMSDLLAATQEELSKQGKIVLASDFKEYGHIFAQK